MLTGGLGAAYLDSNIALSTIDSCEMLVNAAHSAPTKTHTKRSYNIILRQAIVWGERDEKCACKVGKVII